MHMWLVSCTSIPRLIVSFALNGSFVHALRTKEIYIVFHCAQGKRFQNALHLFLLGKEGYSIAFFLNILCLETAANGSSPVIKEQDA